MTPPDDSLPTDAEAALALLLQAEAEAPLDPAVQERLAQVYAALGRQSDATAAAAAALALRQGSALALYNLGTVYYLAHKSTEAEKWYRRALALDPDLIVANQNLAALLEIEDRLAEAQEFRDRALRRQCLFIETAPEPRHRVLLLAASGLGNIPLDALLPPQTTTRLKWFVEYATDLGESLPPYDLVFNAIGDEDLAGPTRRTLDGFLARCPAPVLNRPEAIRRTQRHNTAALLDGIDGLVIPPVLRWQRSDGPAPALTAAARMAGMTGELLLRPLGSHGGHGLIRLPGPDALAGQDLSAETYYLTAYHDYRRPDGYFRKYRVIFVDRVPYAYHLAISQDWLVHYGSAKMLADPWKRQEEERFLADPAAVLGAAAWQTLTAIAQRLDLDFGGIDFSQLDDGRLLVFEANATMNVHLNDPAADYPYKHIHVPKIFRAFDAMLAARRGLPA